MRKNLDILFGLTAWAIGLFTLAADQFSWGGYSLQWMTWLAPLLWTICVVLMLVFKKRKAWKLWWVWPSFPLAFMVWVLLAIMMFGQR